MGRLTKKDEKGNWSVNGLEWSELSIGQQITRRMSEKLYGALCKLKDYEDTGLTPEEVMYGEMSARWIPCSERLSEDNICVLVQVNGKHKNITFENAFEFATHIKGEGWILESYPDWHKPNIVAWQSLPETYREKRREQENE